MSNESWRNFKMEQLGETVSGGTPKTSISNYWDGDINWMTPTDVTALRGKKYITSTNRRVTKEGLESSSANMLPIGTLIICTRATIGDSVINKVPISTNQGFKSLIPNENVLSEYLYYWVISNKQTLIKQSSGSTFLELSTKSFKNLDVLLPPLPEQQKIANILSTVDAKIEVIDQQITETQELKKGLMQRLLTKGIGHTEFKDSPLGKIPKSWEVKSLDEIGIELIDGDRGSNYPKSNDFSDEGYCLFLSAKNVTKNGFKFIECQFISEEKDNILRKGKLSRNDFVITTRGSVGHIAFYDESIPFENVRLNSGMVILRDSKGDFNNKFLYQLLISSVVESQIDFITSGSAQPQLTITGLKKMKLPVPSINEQLIIGEILFTISNKLYLLSEKKTTYQELKQGLMQQLLTGKVRVKV